MRRYVLKFKIPMVRYPMSKDEYVYLEPLEHLFEAQDDAAAEAYAERHMRPFDRNWRGKSYKAEAVMLSLRVERVLRTAEERVAAAEAAIAASRNPSPRIRAAAKIFHDHDLDTRRVHGDYKKSYEELEATDQTGFGEFNDIIADALAAADAVT